MAKLTDATLDRIPLVADHIAKLQKRCAFTGTDILAALLYLCPSQEKFNAAVEDAQLLIDGFDGKCNLVRINGRLMNADELLERAKERVKISEDE